VELRVPTGPTRSHQTYLFDPADDVRSAIARPSSAPPVADKIRRGRRARVAEVLMLPCERQQRQ